MRSFRITLALFLITPFIHAQNGNVIQEHLGFDRPEAWAMKYFTAVSLMQGNGEPDTLNKGQFALGFDISNIPYLSKEERTVGFDGIKEENMNKAPFLARPVIHYGITNKLSVSGSYVPQIEVFDRLETHMASLFFNYDLLQKGRFQLTLKLGAQWSEAIGDFTCAEEISGIMDFEINPYGCIEPSHDRFTSLTGTVDCTLFYRLTKKRAIDAFIDVAYTYADMEFRVDALWGGGFADLREQYASGGIWSFGLGLSFQLTPRLHGNVAVLHSPLDVRRPFDYDLENDSLTYFRFGLNFLL
jgi:hypothetical protein